MAEAKNDRIQELKELIDKLHIENVDYSKMNGAESDPVNTSEPIENDETVNPDNYDAWMGRNGLTSIMDRLEDYVINCRETALELVDWYTGAVNEKIAEPSDDKESLKSYIALGETEDGVYSKYVKETEDLKARIDSAIADPSGDMSEMRGLLKEAQSLVSEIAGANPEFNPASWDTDYMKDFVSDAMKFADAQYEKVPYELKEALANDGETNPLFVARKDEQGNAVKDDQGKIVYDPNPQWHITVTGALVDRFGMTPSGRPAEELPIEKLRGLAAENWEAFGLSSEKDGSGNEDILKFSRTLKDYFQKDEIELNPGQAQAIFSVLATLSLEDFQSDPDQLVADNGENIRDKTISDHQPDLNRLQNLEKEVTPFLEHYDKLNFDKVTDEEYLKHLETNQENEAGAEGKATADEKSAQSSRDRKASSDFKTSGERTEKSEAGTENSETGEEKKETGPTGSREKDAAAGREHDWVCNVPNHEDYNKAAKKRNEATNQYKAVSRAVYNTPEFVLSNAEATWLAYKYGIEVEGEGTHSVPTMFEVYESISSVVHFNIFHYAMEDAICGIVGALLPQGFDADKKDKADKDVEDVDKKPYADLDVKDRIDRLYSMEYGTTETGRRTPEENTALYGDNRYDHGLQGAIDDLKKTDPDGWKDTVKDAVYDSCERYMPKEAVEGKNATGFDRATNFVKSVAADFKYDAQGRVEKTPDGRHNAKDMSSVDFINPWRNVVVPHNIEVYSKDVEEKVRDYAESWDKYQDAKAEYDSKNPKDHSDADNEKYNAAKNDLDEKYDAYRSSVEKLDHAAHDGGVAAGTAVDNALDDLRENGSMTKERSDTLENDMEGRDRKSIGTYNVTRVDNDGKRVSETRQIELNFGPVKTEKLDAVLSKIDGADRTKDIGHDAVRELRSINEDKNLTAEEKESLLSVCADKDLDADKIKQLEDCFHKGMNTDELKIEKSGIKGGIGQDKIDRILTSGMTKDETKSLADALTIKNGKSGVSLEGRDEKSIDSLIKGAKDGLTGDQIRDFAFGIKDSDKMEYLRSSIESGADEKKTEIIREGLQSDKISLSEVKSYAESGLSTDQMKDVKDRLEAGMDEKAESRCIDCLEKGLSDEQTDEVLKFADDPDKADYLQGKIEEANAAANEEEPADSNNAGTDNGTEQNRSGTENAGTDKAEKTSDTGKQDNSAKTEKTETSAEKEKDEKQLDRRLGDVTSHVMNGEVVPEKETGNIAGLFNRITDNGTDRDSVYRMAGNMTDTIRQCGGYSQTGAIMDNILMKTSLQDDGKLWTNDEHLLHIVEGTETPEEAIAAVNEKPDDAADKVKDAADTEERNAKISEIENGLESLPLDEVKLYAEPDVDSKTMHEAREALTAGTDPETVGKMIKDGASPSELKEKKVETLFEKLFPDADAMPEDKRECLKEELGKDISERLSDGVIKTISDHSPDAASTSSALSFERLDPDNRYGMLTTLTEQDTGDNGLSEKDASLLKGECERPDGDRLDLGSLEHAVSSASGENGINSDKLSASVYTAREEQNLSTDWNELSGGAKADAVLIRAGDPDNAEVRTVLKEEYDRPDSVPRDMLDSAIKDAVKPSGGIDADALKNGISDAHTTYESVLEKANVTDKDLPEKTRDLIAGECLDGGLSIDSIADDISQAKEYADGGTFTLNQDKAGAYVAEDREKHGLSVDEKLLDPNVRAEMALHGACIDGTSNPDAKQMISDAFSKDNPVSRENVDGALHVYADPKNGTVDTESLGKELEYCGLSDDDKLKTYGLDASSMTNEWKSAFAEETGKPVDSRPKEDVIGEMKECMDVRISPGSIRVIVESNVPADSIRAVRNGMLEDRDNVLKQAGIDKDSLTDGQKIQLGPELDKPEKERNDSLIKDSAKAMQLGMDEKYVGEAVDGKRDAKEIHDAVQALESGIDSDHVGKILDGESPEKFFESAANALNSGVSVDNIEKAVDRADDGESPEKVLENAMDARDIGLDGKYIQGCFDGEISADRLHEATESVKSGISIDNVTKSLDNGDTAGAMKDARIDAKMESLGVNGKEFGTVELNTLRNEFGKDENDRLSDDRLKEIANPDLSANDMKDLISSFRNQDVEQKSLENTEAKVEEGPELKGTAGSVTKPETDPRDDKSRFVVSTMKAVGKLEEGNDNAVAKSEQTAANQFKNDIESNHLGQNEIEQGADKIKDALITEANDPTKNFSMENAEKIYNDIIGDMGRNYTDLSDHESFTNTPTSSEVTGDSARNGGESAQTQPETGASQNEGGDDAEPDEVKEGKGSERQNAVGTQENKGKNDVVADNVVAEATGNKTNVQEQSENTVAKPEEDTVKEEEIEGEKTDSTESAANGSGSGVKIDGFENAMEDYITNPAASSRDFLENSNIMYDGQSMSVQDCLDVLEQVNEQRNQGLKNEEATPDADQRFNDIQSSFIDAFQDTVVNNENAISEDPTMVEKLGQMLDAFSDNGGSAADAVEALTNCDDTVKGIADDVVNFMDSFNDNMDVMQKALEGYTDADLQDITMDVMNQVGSILDDAMADLDAYAFEFGQVDLNADSGILNIQLGDTDVQVAAQIERDDDGNVSAKLTPESQTELQELVYAVNQGENSTAMDALKSSLENTETDAPSLVESKNTTDKEMDNDAADTAAEDEAKKAAEVQVSNDGGEDDNDTSSGVEYKGEDF